MHDIRFIRENPDAFDKGLARRGLPARSAEIIGLDEKARGVTTRLQDLQTKRNAASRAIGAAKGRKDEAAAARLMAEVEAVKQEMPRLEAEEAAAKKALDDILAAIPNLPADDVPDGTDEHGNVEVRKWGEPRRINNAKEHFDIGEALGMMDFETAAKMSGARFVLLSGALARMERALGNLMLDTHTEEFGYTECSPPLLVKDQAAFGVGQLPKFEDDLFQAASSLSRLVDEAFSEGTKQQASITQGLENFKFLQTLLSGIAGKIDSAGDLQRSEYLVGFLNDAIAKTDEFLGEANQARDRHQLQLDQVKQIAVKSGGKSWLIPTAELPLTNIVADSILDDDTLPRRFTAWTPCFRSEAGAAGKDTRGMIRMHQFSKVELVSITTPERSNEEHERMTACAEAILKKLELPFRTMALCAGDMGFASKKTYDIEVFLPGQNRYREISSCSNCGDFQARRMKARWRRKGEKGAAFVHTLNGSGLAVGRTLVAILENYQQADGSVAVPAALQGYMGGMTVVGK